MKKIKNLWSAGIVALIFSLLAASCTKFTESPEAVHVHRDVVYIEPGTPVDELAGYPDSLHEVLAQKTELIFNTSIPITIHENAIVIADDVPDIASTLTDTWDCAISKNDFNQLVYCLNHTGWFEAHPEINVGNFYHTIIPDANGKLKRGPEPVNQIIQGLKSDQRIGGTDVLTRVRYRNKSYIGGSPATFVEVASKVGTIVQYDNSLNYHRTNGTNSINGWDLTIASLVQNSSIPTDFDATQLDPSGAIFFSGCIYDNVWYPGPVTVYYNGIWEQPIEDGVGAAVYATCADETLDADGVPDINSLNTYMVQPYVWAYYNLFIYVNNV